jgi:hypothetical protein
MSQSVQTVQYLTDEHGERTAVVLRLSEYEKLLEDLEDLAAVAERRDEPTIPHNQFIAELKQDGILHD